MKKNKNAPSANSLGYIDCYIRKRLNNKQSLEDKKLLKEFEDKNNLVSILASRNLAVQIIKIK